MADRATLTFRTARPSDVAALVALVESCYRGDASRAGWTTEADLLDGERTSPAEVAALVASERSRIVCCDADGELVGCCRLDRDPDGSAYLGMLSVRPALQGAGLGRAILAEAERVAAEEWGADRMRMLVIRQRDELIDWYLRLGYRPTGETRPFDAVVTDEHTFPRRGDLEFVVLVKALG